MAGKAILKESFRKNVIRDMKSLGVYKPEYDPIIGIYCEIHEQYQRLMATYMKSDYQIDGGDVAIARRLETLRKDFITYNDRLKLNPKAHDMPDKKLEKKSKLAQVLEVRTG